MVEGKQRLQQLAYGHTCLPESNSSRGLWANLTEFPLIYVSDISIAQSLYVMHLAEKQQLPTFKAFWYFWSNLAYLFKKYCNVV